MTTKVLKCELCTNIHKRERIYIPYYSFKLPKTTTPITEIKIIQIMLVFKLLLSKTEKVAKIKSNKIGSSNKSDSGGQAHRGHISTLISVNLLDESIVVVGVQNADSLSDEQTQVAL